MTYAYNPGGVWTGSHQMRMNGKQENFTIEDFDACGRSLNLKPKDIREMLEAIRMTVQNWEVYAERADVNEADMEKIKAQHILF